MTGLRAMDLFAGAGGLSLGLRRAGIRAVVANGSPKTVAASSKETPCFRRFSLALRAPIQIPVVWRKSDYISECKRSEKRFRPLSQPTP